MKPSTATPTRLATANQITGLTNDVQEQIRRRAYEFYQERGREDGHDLADWLQAESEVTRPRSKARAA
jgi:hypothetical protein